MLLRSLHIASRQLFYLAAASIIVALIGLIAAMWLSDEVAKRKDELAAWASQKTGYPVKVGEAGLYWFDLIPKLEVHQVELMQKDGDEAILSAGQVYLSLDLIETLAQGEPVVADASIRQAKLSVERDEQGQLSLRGLAKSSTYRNNTNVTEALRWFSWLKQLELNEIQLNYTDKQKTELSGNYRLKQLGLTFAGQEWLANADIQLPQHIGNDMQVSARLSVDENYAITAWDMSLNTDELSFVPLVSDLNFNGMVLTSGLIGGSIHADQNQLGQLNAELELRLSDSSLNSKKHADSFEQLDIERLQGNFAVLIEDKSWQVKGDSLLIQIAGEPWPYTKFEVNKQQDGTLTAQTDYVRLSDVTAAALLMNDMPEWLVTSKPAGDVEKLFLRYQPELGVQHLQVEVKSMAMLPWQNYPGANDLSFKLDWEPEQGQLNLDSHQTTIYADSWLDDAVYIDSLTGSVSWRKDQDNWHLFADALRIWNKDFNLSLDGRVNHQNQTTDTDLRLALQDIDVKAWRSYVPERLLPEDFEHWSREAFRDGIIRKGLIELQGDPSAFPFDKQPQQGKFFMQLDVEQAQLHYAEGWPDLMQVNGQITGHGNDLLIKSQSGTIAEFNFEDVTTTINNLVRPKPILRVDGKLGGTTDGALAFLQNSPLKRRFGVVTEWIQATGQSDINLELMVPLVEPDSTEARGHVTFLDSQLTTKAVPGLEITAINGQLQFDNSGVQAQSIQAKAFDKPVKIDVVPEDNRTRVDVSGHASTSALRGLWPELIPHFVSGDSDYLTQVVITEPKQGEFDLSVNIHSDLRGISIDTPSPLGKTASERKPFELNIETDGTPNYQLSLENWLSASLTESESGLVGEIVLGGEKAKPVSTELTVSGVLDKVNLDDWMDWQSSQQRHDSSEIALDHADVSVKELSVGQHTLEDINIIALPERDQWKLQLQSPQIKGAITVPEEMSNEHPLQVKLDYLRLDLEKSSTTAVASKAELWPALWLDISEFELNQMRLGQLNLRASRTENSWSIETASLNSPVLQASLTGSWTQSSVADRSQFDIVASSDDLKGLLAYYGYQEVIEAKQVQLNTQLNWQGDPSQFALASMRGQLDLAVGRGSLIEVEPGAAGRIFGLLSIAAIPRRLALDFSDLFGKGFDFSTITGHFDFADGIARTDDLVMQGDSALIEVMGPVNMVDKTYDQTVKVTPEVSSTLPLAGAVAGGPIGLGVGTAILLVDKIAGTLFDREIVNLISYQYALTGPWESPKLNVMTTKQPQAQPLR